ncbi:MAG: hypothetical protein JWM14_2527 [Chitinophagaceae bacterium]|nr:hypothetical protein [Chitinophagaceae bacterium]
MYTKISFCCFFLLLTSLAVQAQELQVKNTKNGKVRTLKANQSFSFKLSADDEYKKGKIQSFTDTSLVIFTPEEDDIQLREVKLKEIYAIRKMSCLHKVGYAAGAVLIVGGVGTMLEAPSIAGDDGSDWLVRGAGLVVTAIGVVPYLIKPKEFVQGVNAEYKIVVSGK